MQEVDEIADRFALGGDAGSTLSQVLGAITSQARAPLNPSQHKLHRSDKPEPVFC